MRLMPEELGYENSKMDSAMALAVGYIPPTKARPVYALHRSVAF